MKNILLCCLILVAFKAHSQVVTDTLAAAIAEPTLIKKSEYSIKMPPGWRIQDGCVDKLCSMLSPPDTVGGGYDAYVENINITVENLSSPSYTAEKYTEFSIGYLPKVVKNFKLTQKKKLAPNVYVVNYKGIKSGYEQSWRQFYHVKNGKVYIVTFAAETRKFEYYEPIVESFLRSFKVK